MSGYELISELMDWDAKIQELVRKFGLNPCEQEFEIGDHTDMMSAMAYAGMTSRYPHWSFGKAYELTKTLYDYGIQGLPYEMVINSNPALAYLMRDNTLLLHILTIAHVYGHNDFFMNNDTFKSTNPSRTIERFNTHAKRVRAYRQDPSIGEKKVEELLDAAHAVAFQCRRNFNIRKMTREEQIKRALEDAQPRRDGNWALHKPPETKEVNIHKIPFEPEEDFLLFIRDYNPFLENWEKDILTIVDEETKYFIPMIETKIMNEGWASYWHKKILESLNLPQNLHLEFIVRHNQVVQPMPGQINPYYLGLKMLEYIKRRFDEPTAEEIKKYGKPTRTGDEQLFLVRESMRDTSFIHTYFTEELARELKIFGFEAEGDDLKVSNVADDEESWRKIQDALIKQIGMNSLPVIRIEDMDLGDQTLLIKHYHDGRDLDYEHAEKTMAYTNKLWKRKVVLETIMHGKKKKFSHDGKGFKED